MTYIRPKTREGGVSGRGSAAEEEQLERMIDGNPSIGRYQKIPSAKLSPRATEPDYDASVGTSAMKRAGLGTLIVTAALAAVYFFNNILPTTDFGKVYLAPQAKIEAPAGRTIGELAAEEGIKEGDRIFHLYEQRMLNSNQAYVGPNNMKRMGQWGKYRGVVSLSSTGVYALNVDRDGDFSGKQPVK